MEQLPTLITAITTGIGVLLIATQATSGRSRKRLRREMYKNDILMAFIYASRANVREYNESLPPGVPRYVPLELPDVVVKEATEPEEPIKLPTQLTL